MMHVGEYDVAKEGLAILQAELGNDQLLLSVHWLCGTRYYANPHLEILHYSVDDIAQQAIKEIQTQKSKSALTDRDIIDILGAKDALIALYKRFQTDSSLASRFFKCLWEWLGFQPTEAAQIAALEECTRGLNALSFDAYKLKYDDPSQAKLTQDTMGKWTHPDLEGSYAEEEPNQVCMTLAAFNKHLEEQEQRLG